MGKSKFDKSCKVCHTAYKYCSGCSDYASYPRWMESFCSDNCRQIFNIYMKNKAGLENVAEAKAELLKCDLSKKGQFEVSLKNGIESIIGNPTKAVESPKVDFVEEPAQIEEPKVEDVNIEEPKKEDVKVDEEKPVEDNEKQKADEPKAMPKNNKFSGYKKFKK